MVIFSEACRVRHGECTCGQLSPTLKRAGGKFKRRRVYTVYVDGVSHKDVAGSGGGARASSKIVSSL